MRYAVMSEMKGIPHYRKHLISFCFKQNSINSPLSPILSLLTLNSPSHLHPTHI